MNVIMLMPVSHCPYGVYGVGWPGAWPCWPYWPYSFFCSWTKISYGQVTVETVALTVRVWP